jgi:LacI family transcriptional regulator
VTLQDVALAAGVTISTASRSLNNAYGVHLETRACVVECARRLNYRPNRLARGLATGHSNVIGLIVSDIRNPYFAEVARGVEDAAYAAGRDVMLCNSDLKPDRQLSYIESLIEKRVDGIIMNSVSALTRNEQFYIANCGVPIVLLNPHTGESRFSTACADNEKGGRIAAEHLLANGHRRLMHFTGPKQHANLTLRTNGFVKKVQKFGQGAEVTVLSAERTSEGGYHLAKQLFSDRSSNWPTAIFTANDAMAFGVIRAAMEMGVSIPGKLSLIGFDDVELAGLVHPPLTTIRQPKYQIGAAALQILLRRVSSGAKEPEHSTFGVELVERKSTRSIQSR